MKKRIAELRSERTENDTLSGWARVTAARSRFLWEQDLGHVEEGLIGYTRFNQRSGIGKARELPGDDLPPSPTDLNQKLAA